MSIEPNHGPIIFEGEASVEVLDPAGVAPQNIINATDPFTVRVTMTYKGNMSVLTLNNAGFQWVLTAYVDNIGPPWHQEKQIGTPTKWVWKKYTPNPGPPAYLTYVTDINIPAGTLLPGLYKLGVVITSEDTGGAGISGGIYGFAEGAVFQIA